MVLVILSYFVVYGDMVLVIYDFCFCVGFSIFLFYFYFVYFIILLVYREMRDFEYCVKKYKVSWDRYCERVKYRICFFVY